jgi:hypothetical protein
MSSYQTRLTGGEENAGEPLAQTLHLNAHELLVWAN